MIKNKTEKLLLGVSIGLTACGCSKIQKKRNTAVSHEAKHG